MLLGIQKEKYEEQRKREAITRMHKAIEIKKKRRRKFFEAFEKEKSIARLKVRMDLSAMEIGLARLDKMFNESKPLAEIHEGGTLSSHD